MNGVSVLRVFNFFCTNDTDLHDLGKASNSVASERWTILVTLTGIHTLTWHNVTPGPRSCAFNPVQNKPQMSRKYLFFLQFDDIKWRLWPSPRINTPLKLAWLCVVRNKSSYDQTRPKPWIIKRGWVTENRRQHLRWTVFKWVQYGQTQVWFQHIFRFVRIWFSKRPLCCF